MVVEDNLSYMEGPLKLPVTEKYDGVESPLHDATVLSIYIFIKYI